MRQKFPINPKHNQRTARTHHPETPPQGTFEEEMRSFETRRECCSSMGGPPSDSSFPKIDCNDGEFECASTNRTMDEDAKDGASPHSSLVIVYGGENDDSCSSSISSEESPPSFPSRPLVKKQHFQKEADRLSSVLEASRKRTKRGIGVRPEKPRRRRRGPTPAAPTTVAASPFSVSTRQLIHMTLSVLFALWIFLSALAFFQHNVIGDDASRLILPDQRHSRSQLRTDMSALDSAQTELKRGFPDSHTRAPLRSTPFSLSSRQPIPLPLPPNKVSVVIMNHNRPRMLQESSLMRTLLSHPSVDEIILLHSNPTTAFVYDHPKVINLDASRQNDEMGLSLRFYFCQFVSNDWVLHVDDDMELTLGALSSLLIEFNADTHRIVGKWGRGLDSSSPYNDYHTADIHKNAEVVLTKFMILERQLCSEFMSHSHLIWEDVVLGNSEGPLWNGEDVFMSLVSNHVFGNGKAKTVNYAMPWLDVWNAPDDLKDYENSKFDISAGRQGFRMWDWHWWQSFLRRYRHYSYRGKLWKIAKQRLEDADNDIQAKKVTIEPRT